MGKKNKRRKRSSDLHDEQTLRMRRMGVLMLMDRKEILIRIIDNAIMLWFEDRDPVSIHILACVAHRNLDTLGEAKGRGGPTLKQHVEWEQLYSAYDSFRHSTGNPASLDQFAPVNTQFLLTDCVVSFHSIFEFRTPWMNTFGSYCTLPRLRLKTRKANFLWEFELMK